MRTQEETNRQIEGLEEERKTSPEFSFFGDNNWRKIDTKIEVLKGEKSSDDFSDENDDDEETAELYNICAEVEDWMSGLSDDDLFSNE